MALKERHRVSTKSMYPHVSACSKNAPSCKFTAPTHNPTSLRRTIGKIRRVIGL